jgi:hypothetical protein
MSTSKLEWILLTKCIARLLLHDVERAAAQRPNTTIAERSYALNIESDIAASMLKIARTVGSTGRCGAEEISPFCLEAMYRSGIFYARQARNTREQSDLEALEEIKSSLVLMNDRWRASGTQLVTAYVMQHPDRLLSLGTYREMLEARILSGIL